jgi:YihY family inner membrane protein
MNPVERLIRRADAAQQRHQATGFVVGVVKKFGDDNGGVLVTNLAYATFVSVFPLLLILVTVLVNIAAGSPSLRDALINGAARQFPLIGHQLAGKVHALQRSSLVGLVVGLLLLCWGVTSLAQAGLFTMEQVWNLPGPARPGYLQRLARSVLFLAVLAVGLMISTGLAGLASYGHHSLALAVPIDLLAAVANSGLYLASFRVLTPKGVPTQNLLAGAIAGGVAWTVLQALGAYLVHHFLRSDSVYGVFATVLGLLAWIYLGVRITVYAAEINVVLTRRLWPRALIQPPLTEADRASMALQALANQRRKEQQIEVTFSDRPGWTAAPSGTPQHPDEVAPPARRKGVPRETDSR